MHRFSMTISRIKKAGKPWLLKQTRNPWFTTLKNGLTNGYYQTEKAIFSPYSNLEKQRYIHGSSVDSLLLPYFLGIGTPQSGTTWLYQNLRCHSELFLPVQKEVSYFDKHFHRSLRYYSKYFTSGHTKVKGEISPNYCIIPSERIRFIRKIMPDVRLILIMRNPIDRIWSNARRMFSIIASDEGKTLEEIDESEFYAFFQADYAYNWRGIKRTPGDFINESNRGNYPKILDNWLKIFPREQLCVVFFDDIATSPKRVLNMIFRHIGVSTNVDWNFFPYKQTINKNPEVDIPPKFRVYLEDMFCRDIEVLYERFGSPVEKWRCSS